MYCISRIALVALAGLHAVATTTGCKVTSCTETTADGGMTTKDNCYQLEPTVEYRDGRVRTGFQNWAIGTGVTVINRNGPLNVEVDPGLDGQVVFSGIAFTREVSGEAGKQKATDRLATTADPAINLGPSGNIVVEALGKELDGYDLTVRLPTNFNGPLSIDAKNGKLTLRGSGEIPSTTAVAHGIFAEKLRNTIHLTSAVGDIDVSALPSRGGNVIHNELGDIRATIGMANLTITAKTDFGAKVTFPPAWTGQVISADGLSGTATLGDGSGSLLVTTENGDIVFSQ
jgi:hypothetical protein